MTTTVDPTKKALTRVTCAPFATPWVRAELEALGHAVQEEDHAAVDVGASLVDALDLVLRLRTAHHVLWLLKRFRCPSPKALYVHAASYPWEALIPPDGYLSVVSSVENPKINNSMYPSLVLKDAIVDRIARHAGERPDAGPDRTGVVIHLFWKQDRVWIYLGVNGAHMADRGYRKMPHTAPVRETLASALLMAAGYDGRLALVNPMCGSGTIAIEAALMAGGRAPGLLRADASALHTRLDLRDAWEDARRRARAARPPTPEPAPIVATDHDPEAVDAARRNARTAGVEHLIEFRVCDFADSPVAGAPGHVIVNPEYGERLGDVERLGETYERLGDYFKQKCAGWRAHVLTGNRELAKRIGLRAHRKHPFLNGAIECRLLSYELYEGTRRRSPSAGEEGALEGVSGDGVDDGWA